MGENSIPTGEILPVQNTIFDFRKPRNLGEAIQTTPKDGYDDYWCLTAIPHHIPKHAAKCHIWNSTFPKFFFSNFRFFGSVYHPKTGINMEILTTQPGLLMYTGNYLNKSVIGKYGEVSDRHSSVCFETQGYPNAVHVVR
jgi:aldose 1-epimerase